jgi:hypothetical protein
MKRHIDLWAVGVIIYFLVVIYLISFTKGNWYLGGAVMFLGALSLPILEVLRQTIFGPLLDLISYHFRKNYLAGYKKREH